MSQFFSSIQPLVFANAGTNSNVFNGLHVYSDSRSIMIYSPTGLSDTVVLQVNPDEDATNASSGWCGLTTDGTTVLAVPAADKARTYDISMAGSFRLHCAAGASGALTFAVTKNFVITC
jgi:hypothetical protein